MAVKQVCDKCGARLIMGLSHYGQPERMKCLICGFSVWFEGDVKMKDIPQSEIRFSGNQYTMSGKPMNKAEKRAANRLAQIRFRSKLRGASL